MVELTTMMCRKRRTGESEQNRTENAEGRSFFYLVMLTKSGFRQSNIVCIGILSLLIVKANDLAFFKW